ncbi:MAG: hypothetical protein JSR24_20020 [Proteobacteria bacterium]|nr:hypothetical protein [Pseudomonadota bacterium]
MPGRARLRLNRRSLLLAGAPFLLSRAHAEPAATPSSGVQPDWLGVYWGALAFYGSIPLEDIVPPPPKPHVDLDDRTPFGAAFSIREQAGATMVWSRITAGPMETPEAGETLRFGIPIGGLAPLIDSDAKPAPRSATLTVRPDSLGTEALFSYADGSFWRRHFNVRFTPDGAQMIVWVFDAAGTRARTWRGSAVRQPAYDGRGPT